MNDASCSPSPRSHGERGNGIHAAPGRFIDSRQESTGAAQFTAPSARILAMSYFDGLYEHFRVKARQPFGTTTIALTVATFPDPSVAAYVTV